MKAIVYTEYGSADLLRLDEVDKPVPGEGQVVLEVRAAALNPADRHIMHGAPAIVRKMMGLTRPSVDNPGRIGRDVAGVIEAVGKDVTEFKPGEEVFGCCVGACAEYVLGSAAKVVPKPRNVTFEEAASSPVATFTALQGLRKGDIRPGSKVLVNGASGGVGTYAVQIAKVLGAEVTGVCSTRNLDLVRSIGADHLIDYTQEDFTKSSQRYDLVLDCVWTHSWAESKRVLAPGGSYVVVGGPVSAGLLRFLARMAFALISAKLSGRRFIQFIAKSNKEDLETIRDLMECGKVKAVIDRAYKLTETADAMRYLEEGHARGKIIVTVDHSEPR